jgi:AraC family transcriptional regulator of adaptative response/methylated-DNA-[protein]-cysteine methyltransferase
MRGTTAIRQTGSNQSALWRAVLTRDAAQDDRFVFAVRSTGIYCRPSCPSRRPRRRQVVFFPTPQAAERAGFRRCKRCGARADESTSREHQEIVARVCRYIEANLETPLTLSALAAHAGVGAHRLLRVFCRALGITPRQYADALRVGAVKKHLRGGRDVTTALYDAGFGSSSRLYERADAHLGMTPATYRRGGAGMKIHYATSACALGRILVAATERGISALFLGDADAPLERALRDEFPNAEIRRATNGMKHWMDEILRHIEGKRPQLDLPIDVVATAFQRRVWEALRRIPYGSTRTYSQIARQLGKPNAVRAVARACATNPASVVIPCHRVVRTDGALAGYRWGLKFKRALLEKENQTRTA